jgi:hypothetical protein
MTIYLIILTAIVAFIFLMVWGNSIRITKLENENKALIEIIVLNNNTIMQQTNILKLISDKFEILSGILTPEILSILTNWNKEIQRLDIIRKARNN